RLTRRGVSLGAGILATVLSEPSASAAMAMLRKTTVKGVLRCTLGKARGTLSAEVIALAQETLPMITTVKARLGIVVFLALTMIAGGAGLLAHQPTPSNGEDKKQPDQTIPPAKQTQEVKKQPRLDRFGDPLPADAVGRLGTVRFRHGGEVLRPVFAPGG